MITNGPALPTEMIISADGTELALQCIGSGPAVVLLHDSGGALHAAAAGAPVSPLLLWEPPLFAAGPGYDRCWPSTSS